MTQVWGYQFQGQELRVVGIQTDTLRFVLEDVCNILELDVCSAVSRLHISDINRTGIQDEHGLQEVSLVSVARLAHWYQGLQAALVPFAEPYQTLAHGAAWLHDIAYLVEPVATAPSKAAEVARQLRSYLDTVQRQAKGTPTVEAFGRHLDTVSQSYWPGLFHYYEVPSLPRTNNELESHFRETRRRLLRTMGQQGQTQRTLQRLGAWELLSQPPTEAKLQEDLSQTSPQDLAQERQRFAAHRQRFRLQSRSLRQTQAPFDQLCQQWSVLPPTGTG